MKDSLPQIYVFIVVLVNIIINKEMRSPFRSLLVVICLLLAVAHLFSTMHVADSFRGPRDQEGRELSRDVEVAFLIRKISELEDRAARSREVALAAQRIQNHSAEQTHYLETKLIRIRKKIEECKRRLAKLDFFAPVLNLSVFDYERANPPPLTENWGQEETANQQPDEEDGGELSPPPGEQSRGVHGEIHDEVYIIPVLVLTYRRVENLKKCLDKIFLVMPKEGFRLYVSQDSLLYPEITNLIKSYGSKIVHLIHQRNDTGATSQEQRQGFKVYYAISHHYGWAIEQVFSHSHAYDRIILLEEDIDVANDFFAYMTAMGRLLDLDKTLFCVSAWNDNGKPELTHDPAMAYRTDFFPGLGWMLTREFWNEILTLHGGWPNGFWDDWLRQTSHRRGRSCIRPEVPRTFTWCSGGLGASGGQFCDTLVEIRKSKVSVAWNNMDLSYLLKPNYDLWLNELLSSATPVSGLSELGVVLSKQKTGKEIKIHYRSDEEFSQHAVDFGLMDDAKDGVPRMAYGGVVTFRFQTKRIHLVSKQRLYR